MFLFNEIIEKRKIKSRSIVKSFINKKVVRVMNAIIEEIKS